MARTVRVRGIVDYGGNILCVKSKRPDTHWALPGGGVEDGEELSAALTREIQEELGMTPIIGRLLYVHQLFTADFESLEFFFHIENSRDFQDIDLTRTTHGVLELSEVAFIAPTTPHILPDFLASFVSDMAQADWPKVYTRRA